MTPKPPVNIDGVRGLLERFGDITQQGATVQALYAAAESMTVELEDLRVAEANAFADRHGLVAWGCGHFSYPAETCPICQQLREAELRGLNLSIRAAERARDNLFKETLPRVQ